MSEKDERKVIHILREDKYLLVITKPAGMTVNRSDTVAEGTTLQDWIEDNSKVVIQSESPAEFRNRSGMVHRLDKETSGCLIIAKTAESFLRLQQQFKNREVEKEYLALVYGKVEPKEGTIRAPLMRSRYDRQKFMVAAGEGRRRRDIE